MPRIFISYRRADSVSIAGRIYEHLSNRFGADNVFKDVDDIPPGMDFRSVITSEINQSDVMLVIVGTRWHTVGAGWFRKSRLFNQEDAVRIEVESGLLRGDKLLVVPILVSGASMPAPAALPNSIRSLVYKNAAFIRDDPDFNRDMGWLIAGLEDWLRNRELGAGDAEFIPPAASVQALAPTRSNPRLSPVLMLGGLATILLALIIGLLIVSGGGNRSDSMTPEVTESPEQGALVPTDIPSATETDTPTPTTQPTATNSPTPTLLPTNTPGFPAETWSPNRTVAANREVWLRQFADSEAPLNCVLGMGTRLVVMTPASPQPTFSGMHWWWFVETTNGQCSGWVEQTSLSEIAPTPLQPTYPPSIVNPTSPPVSIPTTNLCGNLYCDRSNGEDEFTCSVDCPTLQPSTCGNLRCEPARGEDEFTCSIDCPTEQPASAS